MAYNPQRQPCIYIITEEGIEDVCKIGITELLARRLGGMQTSNWRELIVVAAFLVESISLAQEIESFMLKFCCNLIVRGEWIAIDPDRLKKYLDTYIRTMGIFPINLVGISENQDNQV